MRPVGSEGSTHGSSSKLFASGTAKTSLSCTRLYPSIAKPSNWMPSSKAPSDTVGKYGNQGPYSIPSTICDFFTQDKILNDATILMCGFGVGLSWASAIVKMTNLTVLPPTQYIDG